MSNLCYVIGQIPKFLSQVWSSSGFENLPETIGFREVYSANTTNKLKKEETFENRLQDIWAKSQTFDHDMSWDEIRPMNVWLQQAM